MKPVTCIVVSEKLGGKGALALGFHIEAAKERHMVDPRCLGTVAQGP